ncbi:MAG: ATP-binding protein [Spirochaetae bacterium HGW-Spirochaetae-2]|jgi:fluoroquinolone transport system ATP-binding protein|nr:MAG: ATP-binding protein [Spirochaetae bacterium HGW-Spirochaetae-2]
MIHVQDLQFSYTSHPFIADINFTVPAGEIFGFLGPSGAGKTTIQKILTGLLTGFKGNVEVGGIDLRKSNRDLYERIGVDFEFPSLYEKLTGKENLKFFASLYKHHVAIDPLLESVGLINDADKKVSAYSKGMKSRLDFIKALVHDPDILFLDEPTSGLDPSNARVMKNIILQLKANGKTILLTTHNMYDATELCDRVAFIVDGKLVALDTPHNLIISHGASTVRYSYISEGEEKTITTALDKTGTDALLLQLVKENRLSTIHSSEPTLNDIFSFLTGRELQ